MSARESGGAPPGGGAPYGGARNGGAADDAPHGAAGHDASSGSDAEGATTAEAGRLRVGVLASGRGSNLEALLRRWADGALPVDIVLAASDKPDAPALQRARRYGVRTVALRSADFPDREAFDRAMADELTAAGTGLVVLAGYMRLLTPVFLDVFPRRVINIHPSLLPAFPGLHAPRQALAYGVRWSGCTVHFVDAGMDSGPIILQAAVPVQPDDDEERLAARILEQEHRILPEAVRLFAEGRLRIEGRRVRILPPAASKGRADGA